MSAKLKKTKNSDGLYDEISMLVRKILVWGNYTLVWHKQTRQGAGLLMNSVRLFTRYISHSRSTLRYSMVEIECSAGAPYWSTENMSPNNFANAAKPSSSLLSLSAATGGGGAGTGSLTLMSTESISDKLQINTHLSSTGPGVRKEIRKCQLYSLEKPEIFALQSWDILPDVL